MLVHAGVAVIVACSALSVILFSLVAETHRNNPNKPNQFKFDVQFLPSNWSQPTNMDTHRRLGRIEASMTELVDHTGSHTTDQDYEPILTDLHAYPRFNSSAPKKVALLVFGLQRSLFLTFPSVVDRMIRPLTDVGYEATVFVHQFNDVGASDPHSKGAKGDWWSMLRPFEHSATSQKDFLKANRCAPSPHSLLQAM